MSNQQQVPQDNTTDFDDLSVEQIEVLEFPENSIESLTAGHGLGEMGASTFPSTASCCSA